MLFSQWQDRLFFKASQRVLAIKPSRVSHHPYGPTIGIFRSTFRHNHKCSWEWKAISLTTSFGALQPVDIYLLCARRKYHIILLVFIPNFVTGLLDVCTDIAKRPSFSLRQAYSFLILVQHTIACSPQKAPTLLNGLYSQFASQLARTQHVCHRESTVLSVVSTLKSIGTSSQSSSQPAEGLYSFSSPGMLGHILRCVAGITSNRCQQVFQQATSDSSSRKSRYRNEDHVYGDGNGTIVSHRLLTDLSVTDLVNHPNGFQTEIS